MENQIQKLVKLNRIKNSYFIILDKALRMVYEGFFGIEKHYGGTEWKTIC